MPDAFVLRWKVDRPFIEQNKSEDVYSLITIEPNTAVLADGAVVPTHLILLVDVSGSMDFLMRFDPKAQRVGKQITKGHKSQSVVSDVPSRRETACAVVEKLARRLGPDDLFTLVAFDDKVYVLTREASPKNIGVITAAIQRLADVGGGETATGKGLSVIRSMLAERMDAGRTRKLVLLTDGEDQEPRMALEQARALGGDFHLPIAAFGMGECKVAFLTELAKSTLAGSFNHIRNEADAEQLFHQALAGQKNVQATNACLKLWLSPDVQVRELYRTRPEILFVGDLLPDENNVVQLNLEQMERGKAYEFLFRATLPRRAANQRLRLAKASLRYDLPGLSEYDRSVDANIITEYTADPNRAAERSGDVRRALARAEVQRQVLFLQAKIDRLKSGAGTDQDRAIVANLLRALVAKFEEFGDQAMANQYRTMQQEFQQKGTISQDMLNRSLAASSRAEDMIVAQDIDF